MSKQRVIKDRGTRSHSVQVLLTEQECEQLIKKYQFREDGFCSALKFALEWNKLFIEKEPYSSRETLNRINEIHSSASSLKTHLIKPKASYFYRNQTRINGLFDIKVSLGGDVPYQKAFKRAQQEENAFKKTPLTEDEFEKGHHWDGVLFECYLRNSRNSEKKALSKAKRNEENWHKLVEDWGERQPELEGLKKQVGDFTCIGYQTPGEKLERFRLMNIPPANLTNQVRKSAIRLFKALDYMSDSDNRLLNKHRDDYPEDTDLLTALDWIIRASRNESDLLSRSDPKQGRPQVKSHLSMITKLWWVFKRSKPINFKSIIGWDAYKEVRTGDFFLFAKEVLSLADEGDEAFESIKDETLAGRINSLIAAGVIDKSKNDI